MPVVHHIIGLLFGKENPFKTEVLSQRCISIKTGDVQLVLCDNTSSLSEIIRSGCYVFKSLTHQSFKTKKYKLNCVLSECM